MHPRSWCAALLIAGFVVGCSDDEDNRVAPPTDSISPTLVHDLSASPNSDSTIVLTWTAPGDDGDLGTVAEYDLRYSTSPTGLITPGGWASALRPPIPPTPSTPAETQSFTLGGLVQRTEYHFALMATDEAGNSSGLSNVATSRTFEREPVRLRNWGDPGTGDGQFGYTSPTGIAVDPIRNLVYVADNGRVQKFDTSGNFIRSWGLPGGEPTIIEQVVVDSWGDIYVGRGGRATKYDREGNVLWTSPSSDPVGFGIGIGADGDGNIFVTERYDTDKYRIDKFDRSGAPLLSWSVPRVEWLAIDPSGNVYAVSFVGNETQILKYDNDGVLLKSWDPFQGNPQHCISHMSFDPDGTLYLSNGCWNEPDPRVLRFSSDGTSLGSFRLADNGRPQGVAIDALHSLYVADPQNNRVEVLARDPGASLLVTGAKK